MDNSTQTKTCRKGKDCKHPQGPELPTAEFYPRKSAKDGLYAECIACRKEITRNQTRRPKNQAGEEGERIAVAKLRSVGIYAVAGKSSEFTHVDVTAWGCCRIEVKLADKRPDNNYMFAFSSQRRRGIHADLILLIPRNGDEISYHLFPATHPIFFKHGRVKEAVQYIPYVHHRKRGLYLSTSIMSEFKDAWHLVKQKRDEIEAALLNGSYNPERVKHGEAYQRTLFDVA